MKTLQFHHLNRALGQLVSVSPDGDELRCPELFYLEKGIWAPNDVMPLLWTQANLMLALHQVREVESIPRTVTGAELPVA